jgi:hypothetical protein
MDQCPARRTARRPQDPAATAAESSGTILAWIMAGRGIKVFEITENHAISDLSAARSHIENTVLNLKIDANYQRLPVAHLIS